MIAVSKADNERLREAQKKPTIIEFGDLFKPASELYRYVKERTNSEEYASAALDLSDNLKRYKLNIEYSTRVQRSAIFRGIVSLIILKGAKDFITGQ